MQIWICGTGKERPAHVKHHQFGTVPVDLDLQIYMYGVVYTGSLDCIYLLDSTVLRSYGRSTRLYVRFFM